MRNCHSARLFILWRSHVQHIYLFGQRTVGWKTVRKSNGFVPRVLFTNNRRYGQFQANFKVFHCKLLEKEVRHVNYIAYFK